MLGSVGWRCLGLVMVVATGCATGVERREGDDAGSTTRDAGRDAGTKLDSGRTDEDAGDDDAGSETRDAGMDAGTKMDDAGMDAGRLRDAGLRDAGPRDAGPRDGGGTRDTGPRPDAGPMTITWGTSATAFDCATPGVIGMRLGYVCPAGGTPGSLWGTGEYTHDSSICTAAVHAGRIDFATGGAITVEWRAGRSSYTGSTRYGVTSSSYGAWRCSFAIIEPACPAPRVDCGELCTDTDTDPAHCGACGMACSGTTICMGGTCVCPAGQTLCGSSCVDTMTSNLHCGGCDRPCAATESCAAGTCGGRAITWSTNATEHNCSLAGVIGSRFAYRCPAGSAGSAWGTDIYTHDSSICTAAAHVGRITTATGGDVTIEMVAGQPSYTGSTRNGITTSSWGAWSCSFSVP